MQATVTIRTTVQPGGKIEVSTPDWTPGTAVSVTVSPLKETSRKRSVLEILAECPGGRLFKTAEEVDAYIREERDSWDR